MKGILLVFHSLLSVFGQWLAIYELLKSISFAYQFDHHLCYSPVLILKVILAGKRKADTRLYEQSRSQQVTIYKVLHNITHWQQY